MRRTTLTTDNARYGVTLQLRLEGSGYTAEVYSTDTIGTDKIAEDHVVILDAHAEQPKGTCNSVHWVRTVREQGIGTPFIILTWLPYQEAIVNPQLASNPFIGHYYRSSCRFLQLPIHLERLVKVLNEVRPCTDEEIKVGMRFLAQIGDAHRSSIV